MKKLFLSLLTVLVAAVSAEAKYWKIGPSSVTGMDFESINAAMSSSEVTKGDTLYLDQYYNESAEQTVTKRVVIIGTGYDTSFSDENVVARITSAITLKSNNIEIKSIRIEGNINMYATNCIVDRCFVSGLIKHQSVTAGLNHVYSCYIKSGRIEGYSSDNPSQLDIQNCVILDDSNNPNISNLISSIINNNVIHKSHGYTSNYYCVKSVKNSQITNNLIFGTSIYGGNYGYLDFSDDVVNSGSGNTIEHNVLCGSKALTYYPQNKTGQRDAWIKAGQELADGPATDGGEVGCHGGMFGCPSGGRPQYIPYFSKVVVGSRTEDGKLPVSLTIKIQDE